MMLLDIDVAVVVVIMIIFALLKTLNKDKRFRY